MILIFLFLVCNLIYMEMVFHMYFWGMSVGSVLLSVLFALVIAAVESVIAVALNGKAGKVAFIVFLILDYLLFAVQLVYRSIFTQPLQLAAIIYGAKNALSDYRREALEGILYSTPGLAVMAAGIVVAIVLIKKKKLFASDYEKKDRLTGVGILVSSVTAFVAAFFTGYSLNTEFYEEYSQYYYPDYVMEQYGVFPMAVRDIDILYLPQKETVRTEVVVAAEPSFEAGEARVFSSIRDSLQLSGDSGILVCSTNAESGLISGMQTESGIEAQAPAEASLIDTSPHLINYDFAKLKELAPDAVDKMADTMQLIQPSNKNQYTGMFKGCNLIFLTAEGFSTYAIDEKLTPTLYRLSHSGIVARNYYVPLWQTSTSDGEYINMTGLIPDKQFSMRRSAANKQPYALPAFFQKEGVVSRAYHNNSLSYYSRHLSHNNMGYIFKAAKLGDLPRSEWGNYVFEMENANAWPASDLNMMKATIPEYINDDRFHVYYMTVSGHMNYNFTGNKMAALHKQEVSELAVSEEGKAYIACNMELDRALEYLIQQLESAGKLDNTVICLSADHYPYGMNPANYEELAGRSLVNTLDLYRNTLILWNPKMETIEVTKPCGSMDLVPTLCNLFGFDYDSRIYAGRDILSDSPGLVVFADRSFITNEISYNSKTKQAVSPTGDEVKAEQLSYWQEYVKLIYGYSSGILNHKYYEYLEQALP